VKTLSIGCIVVTAVFGVLALGMAQSGSSTKPARDVATLQLGEEIPVPNVAGRLDHFTADAKRRRLFVSALGNNTVEVIDVFAGRLIHTITGVTEPQGSLYVPEVDKLFVADAGDGKVNVFDGGTFTLRKQIDLGDDPDNVRYHSPSNTVFVGYGHEDGGIAAINPVTEEVGRVYKTGGHPESFQVETSGTHIFVNVPDAGNIVEAIDRTTGSMLKWPLHGLRANFAMALNEADHRLFTITRKTPMLVVLDTETGKEVTRLRVAGTCDDVYFDAERKRIYVIGGEGFISVVQQKDPNHYELIENVPSGVSVKTGYFYAARDRLYVGVPAKGNEPAQVWTYEAED
jgi:hypothetical protein